MAGIEWEWITYWWA